MTATIPEQRFTVATLNLADRAVVLRSLAERWDSLIDSFIEWDKTNTRLLETFIRNMVTPYVHESLRGSEIPAQMRTLADQCRALEDYRTLGLIPDSLDEQEAYGNAPAEVLVALMEQDIDLSLYTLLHGPHAQPCARCKRLNAHVHTWGAASLPWSIFCPPCQQERAQ